MRKEIPEKRCRAIPRAFLTGWIYTIILVIDVEGHAFTHRRPRQRAARIRFDGFGNAIMRTMYRLSLNDQAREDRIAEGDPMRRNRGCYMRARIFFFFFLLLEAVIVTRSTIEWMRSLYGERDLPTLRLIFTRTYNADA